MVVSDTTIHGGNRMAINAPPSDWEEKLPGSCCLLMKKDTEEQLKRVG